MEFGTPFFWRMSLLPHGCNGNKQCNVSAPPVPPSTLDPVQVDQAMYFPREDIVSLAVTWTLPEYSNGVLQHYQLRVGSLPIRNNQESGITFLSRTSIEVSEAVYITVVLDPYNNIVSLFRFCVLLPYLINFSPLPSLPLSSSLPIPLPSLLACRDKFIC